MSGKIKKDVPLILVSVPLIFSLSSLLYCFPDDGKNLTVSFYNVMTETLGPFVLLYTLSCFGFLLYLGFSKYGNVRLGMCYPEYSTFSWIGMMFCAGLGAATLYWAFVEWAYYYLTPPFGVESGTPLAYEWATAYNFFHWGLPGWSIYCLASLPVAYHFHVRGEKGLRLSAVFSKAIGRSQDGISGKVVDLIFILTVFGSLSISLGLSVPMIGDAIAQLLSIKHTFVQDVAILLLISIIYSFSSYIGLDKGMKRLSDFNIYLAIAFTLIILLVGPTLFLVKNSINALGLMADNFFRMCMWTDPINNSGFTELWTVFYWLYWVVFAPFMGLFVARISKGRKIKEVILNMLVSGSAGIWFFFGVLGGFSLHSQLSGKVEVAKMLEEAGGSFVIMQVIDQLPFTNLLLLLFAVVAILFLSTTLDSASFTLASTVSPELKSGEDPSPISRLFWCLMLSALPLVLMLIDAPLTTIKSCAVASAIPLAVILAILIVGLVRWLKEDYGHMHSHEIEEISKLK
ncbi:BCCT family transporter [Methanococcoides sp. FTZ1]|uniref:BCCT family transporter n=1 Tax=Methanococcoides sp. FTZ1 TaxID=3439061 RepID=UPI003F847500